MAKVALRQAGEDSHISISRSGGGSAVWWRQLLVCLVGLLLVLGNPAAAIAEETTDSIEEAAIAAAEAPGPRTETSGPWVDTQSADEVFTAPDETTDPDGAPIDTAPEVELPDRNDDPFIAAEPDPADEELMQVLAATNPTHGIPALSIVMDEGTLADVHADKNEKWASVVEISDPDGSNLKPTAAEFKGRGNTTWDWKKKPYQIKFDKKTSVLGMAKAKAWVLLANYNETSMLRNNTAFTAANELGVGITPHESRFVDLYVNGEYQGLYQLTDKIEVAENRTDLKHPQGVLVELDNVWGGREPAEIRFKTARTGSTFVLKDQVGDVDDDYVMDADVTAGWLDVQDTINKFEQAIAAPNPDWAYIRTLVDLDSFARMYLLDEFATEWDLLRTSNFFYKDGPDDVLHAGPAWDYDRSFGRSGHFDQKHPWTYSIVNADKWYGAKSRTDWYVLMSRQPEFVNLLNSEYDRVGRNAFKKAADSIAPAASKIARAADANHALWPNGLELPPGAVDQATAVTMFQSWMSSRLTFMDATYGDSWRPNLSYSVHSEGSWTPTVSNGTMVGSVGVPESPTPVSAVWLDLLPGRDGNAVNGSIEARATTVNGTLLGWRPEGTTLGTVGGAGLQKIQIQLTGSLATQYDVFYRVYANSYGWLDWVKNGAEAGTTGGSQAFEALQVILIDKGGSKVMPNPYSGWILTSLGQWYYYPQPGLMATGWSKQGANWYYLHPSGAMAIGWANDGSGWYYLTATGAMATGWVNHFGTWFYMHPSGLMATGWLNQGGTWYYLNPDGVMATGWVNDGGTWYYLQPSGAMATGWLRVGNAWYYLQPSGAMATGWLRVGSTWYYLNPDGSMATGSVWIDGRTRVFAGSGAWIS